MSSKKVPSKLFVSGIGSDICCPFVDYRNKLHIVSQNTGSIYSVDSVGNTSAVTNTGGQPSGAVFNSDGVLYVTDFGHSAVLAFTEDSQQELVVGVYEDKPLKGPNSISILDGDIFFTDSGGFGETGLHNPTGSVFTISQSPSGQILKPISLGNLAYPTGIAVTPDKKFIYVAEMMKNRIIRYFQQPAGVYHGSVFHSFNGGVGPSSLALDNNGNLYVGIYDVKDSTSEGSVFVISNVGKVIKTYTTTGPEISGLTISENTLYITERSTGGIFTADIA